MRFTVEKDSTFTCFENMFLSRDFLCEPQHELLVSGERDFDDYVGCRTKGEGSRRIFDHLVTAAYLRNDSPRKSLITCTELRELRRMQNHDNVTKFLDCVNPSGRYCIITEFASLRKMKDYYRAHRRKSDTSVSPSVTLKFMIDFISGLKHLHSKNLVHASLSPGSIHIHVGKDDQGRLLHVAKIADVHFWRPISPRVVGQEEIEHSHGTVSQGDVIDFLSPERSEKNRAFTFTVEDNQFTVGAIILSVLDYSRNRNAFIFRKDTRGIPNGQFIGTALAYPDDILRQFGEEGIHGLINRIVDHHKSKETESHCHWERKVKEDVIKKLLNPAPEKRMTLSEAADILNRISVEDPVFLPLADDRNRYENIWKDILNKFGPDAAGDGDHADGSGGDDSNDGDGGDGGDGGGSGGGGHSDDGGNGDDIPTEHASHGLINGSLNQVCQPAHSSSSDNNCVGEPHEAQIRSNSPVDPSGNMGSVTGNLSESHAAVVQSDAGLEGTSAVQDAIAASSTVPLRSAVSVSSVTAQLAATSPSDVSTSEHSSTGREHLPASESAESNVCRQSEIPHNTFPSVQDSEAVSQVTTRSKLTGGRPEGKLILSGSSHPARRPVRSLSTLPGASHSSDYHARRASAGGSGIPPAGPETESATSTGSVSLGSFHMSASSSSSAHLEGNTPSTGGITSSPNPFLDSVEEHQDSTTENIPSRQLGTPASGTNPSRHGRHETASFSESAIAAGGGAAAAAGGGAAASGDFSSLESDGQMSIHVVGPDYSAAFETGQLNRIQGGNRRETATQLYYDRLDKTLQKTGCRFGLERISKPAGPEFKKNVRRLRDELRNMSERRRNSLNSVREKFRQYTLVKVNRTEDDLEIQLRHLTFRNDKDEEVSFWDEKSRAGKTYGLCGVVWRVDEDGHVFVRFSQSLSFFLPHEVLMGVGARYERRGEVESDAEGYILKEEKTLKAMQTAIHRPYDLYPIRGRIVLVDDVDTHRGVVTVIYGGAKYYVNLSAFVLLATLDELLELTSRGLDEYLYEPDNYVEE